jgi:hypothetical protein
MKFLCLCQFVRVSLVLLAFSEAKVFDMSTLEPSVPLRYHCEGPVISMTISLPSLEGVFDISTFDLPHHGDPF